MLSFNSSAIKYWYFGLSRAANPKYQFPSTQESHGICFLVTWECGSTVFLRVTHPRSPLQWDWAQSQRGSYTGSSRECWHTAHWCSSRGQHTRWYLQWHTWAQKHTPESRHLSDRYEFINAETNTAFIHFDYPLFMSQTKRGAFCKQILQRLMEIDENR